ncbi:Elongation factor G [Symbiodinium microadriaticum]|uniref:Elongation factor G n=1 Tax=Symbiodinium microadriaticum TaxID=2951 RepID=A0A1Q9EKF5_SYMMI|nr:Elongation factor G [Symbiodinium microadriaticum]
MRKVEQDNDRLEHALAKDLELLQELGLVDYSLLMAYEEGEIGKSGRIRLGIIDFLQPYTLDKKRPKTTKLQRASAAQRSDVDLERPGEPKVNYRETVTAKTPFDYLHKRQSGGRGQYGKVIGYFEPVPEEDRHEAKDGIVFVNKLVGNDIPPSYAGVSDAVSLTGAGLGGGLLFPVALRPKGQMTVKLEEVPSIEKGFRNATQKGLLIGSPLIYMRCVRALAAYLPEEVQTALGSKSEALNHALVDSSSEAFMAAAQGAFENFYSRVEVTFPSEFQAQTMQIAEASEFKEQERQRQMEHANELDHSADLAVKLQRNWCTGSRALVLVQTGQGEFSMEFQEYTEMPQVKQED